MRVRALRVILLCLLVWWTQPAFAATFTVHVFNFNFSTNPQGQPIAEPTINVGDTIHWVWDSGTHTTTSVAGSGESWDSGIMTTGKTFDHTFATAGVFIYYCKIHGSDNGNGTASGMSGMVTVQAAAPSVVSVTVPAAIVGSLNATGTVTLSGPAPAGGAVVSLGSTNPAADVPTSVTVPATATSTTFTITTAVVMKTSIGTISASDNGVVDSKAFKVVPIQIASVKLSPASVTGGADAIGTITLGAPAAPGNITVSLISNDPSVAQPVDGSGNPLSSITIAAGSQTGTFNIATVAVTSATSVSIKATANGASKIAALKVLPVEIHSFTLHPASIKGGNSVTGTITLTAPAAPGSITVTFASNSAAVPAPASIIIPEGASTGTVTIDTDKVTVKTIVTLSATANGVTKTSKITVTP